MDKIRRKSLRMVKKGLHSLNKDYINGRTNDWEVFQLEKESKIVFIANAGLTVGVDEVALFNLFRSFGFVEIQQFLFIPEKQYCFVQFFSTEIAKAAVDSMSGIATIQPKNYPVYLALINKVPLTEKQSLGQLPPGLILEEEFVSENEEKLLTNLINFDATQQSSSELIKQREVRHFGYEFNYETNSVDKSKCCREIPSELMPIMHRILERGYMASIPDQVTITRYLPGQGIPLHVDTHSSFMGEILSLSLLGSIVMDFVLEEHNGKNIRRSVPLKPRSLCVMAGPSRYQWAHGIKGRKTDVLSLKEGNSFKMHLVQRTVRISFTFRKVLFGNCSCSYPLKCDSQFYGKKTVIKDSKKKVALRSHSSIAELEKEHVQTVYEEIADHFSDTRHKQWPKVTEFVDVLPMSSRLLEIGCGNGKYLGKHSYLFELGLDTSLNLLNICRSRQIEVSCANCLQLPFRTSSFDAVICIAVIHHLASEERRLIALKEIVRVLCNGGVALIYVWAMEQRRGKMSTYLKQRRSNRPKHLGSVSENLSDSEASSVNLDCFKSSDSISMSQCKSSLIKKHAHQCQLSSVSEHKFESLSINENQCDSKSQNIQQEVYEKQNDIEIDYDVYQVKSERKSSLNSPDSQISSSVDLQMEIKDYDKKIDVPDSSLIDSGTANEENQKKGANVLSVHENRTDFIEQDLLVPWKINPSSKSKICNEQTSSRENNSETPVYYRFYHVFREGELKHLVQRIPNAKIVNSYYDEGNWCISLRKEN